MAPAAAHSPRALAATLLLAAAARATLVLTSEPPAGFNTFMSYEPQALNATSLPALAALFAASPLAAAGFTDFVVDGGWSDTILANGTAVQNLDGFGRPVPAPDRFPDGLKGIAIGVRALGLKFGLWHIRGIHVDAAARKLPVKGMPQYTLDMLVDAESTGGGPNGSCLWAPEWLGVNASLPPRRPITTASSSSWRRTSAPTLSRATASSAGRATRAKCCSCRTPSRRGPSQSRSTSRPGAGRR